MIHTFVRDGILEVAKTFQILLHNGSNLGSIDSNNIKKKQELSYVKSLMTFIGERTRKVSEEAQRYTSYRNRIM